MHPILRQRRRLVAYLVGWVLVGDLLTLLLGGAEVERWPLVALLLLPPVLLYAFVCLASWYLCRSLPLGETPAWRLAVVHLAAAVASSALWLAPSYAWATAIDAARPATGAVGLFVEQLPRFFAAGILLWLLAVALHYLLLAFDAARAAESRALELELHAQRAELEAFKAQIDPHFLFNCLNSISSLCGSDPAAARRTAIRLGDFLRASLRHGSRDTIALRDEMALASAYLDVERARFGERLVCEKELDRQALEMPVPALVLQPLLENALKHGIAHLVDGGTVAIAARRAGRRLLVEVRNPCDPERPRATGTGIGLANVRGRLRLLYGEEAVMAVRDRGTEFAVEMSIPANLAPAPEPSAAQEVTA